MLNFIGNQFKKPSGFGGKIISHVMKKSNKFAYERIIPKLGINKGDRLLEIGYGHGIGIDMICSDFDCSVTGIDFSELMYKEAQLRNKIHIENNKVALNFGDYLDFKCEKESFDIIFFINVIYFWNNLEKPFKKIKDELKQNGALSIYMVHRDNLKKMKFTTDDIFNKYTIDYVTEGLKRSGFKDVNYKYDNGYYIKCKK